MQTEKHYKIEGYKVIVRFEPKLVRIVGSEQLLNILRTDLTARTLTFVKLIKIDYLTINSRPLKITDESLMIEIWAHLYVSKFAGLAKKLISLKTIEKLTEKIKQRSDTIDCGEESTDSNRKFWDFLSKLFL